MKKLFKNIIFAAMLVMGGIYVSCTSVTDEITELDCQGFLRIYKRGRQIVCKCR